MKETLEAIKFRILDLTDYKQSPYRMSFDLATLEGMIDKCKQVNLKQEMCNWYNELFFLRDEMKKGEDK